MNVKIRNASATFPTSILAMIRDLNDLLHQQPIKNMDILNNIPDEIKYPAFLQLLHIVYLVVKRLLFGTQSESKGIHIVITLAIIHLAGFWIIMQLPDGTGILVILIYCIFAFFAFIMWQLANMD